MLFSRTSPRLLDCRLHGPGSGAELFLVEGDSAAQSVSGQRNRQTQAVLPMQGKPMNAYKASDARVRANPLFRAVFSALGHPDTTGQEAGSQLSLIDDPLRFETVVLLFDPDADGIHSGALMLMFLARYYPALLAQERVLMIRAPLFRVTLPGASQPRYAASEHHLKRLLTALQQDGTIQHRSQAQILRYRGLGSLEPELLITRCVDPQSRSGDIMTPRDAQMAREIFGG